MKTAWGIPLLSASTALLLCACNPQSAGGQGGEAPASADAAAVQPQGVAVMPGDPGREMGHSVLSATGPAVPGPARAGIAALADRGELLEYSRVRAPRGDAKYSFHPVDVSETHALAAIGGALHMRAPDGSPIDLEYERHVEHPSGDWSWIGRDANGVDAVLTFGEKAMFGVLAAASGEALRLTTNAGQVWMVQQNAGVESRTERDIREGRIGPDYKLPGGLGTEAFTPEMLEEGGALAKAAAGVTPAAEGDLTVDLLLGYTPGFVTMMGGASQAQTRLTHLVTVANQAFVNSQVEARLRLVGTLQVNYTDNGTNDSVLDALTGSNGSSSVPVPAALQPLRQERERLGADLVSLVRRFREAEQEGCGIAWLLGGGQTTIVPGHEAFGYSVVGDSNGTLGSDNGYFCRDETLVHELGHNMGSAHDRATAMGDNGTLEPGEYGRYPYSFGYKTGAGAGNFYTVMAYGDSGQTAYRVFSNPQVTTCGGRACGVANQADNARSLRQTLPIIAEFRDAVVAANPPHADFDADGRSDLVWRHAANGRNLLWGGAQFSALENLVTVTDGHWRVVGIGDFDGDGYADLIWRHGGNGRNTIWRRADYGNQAGVLTVGNLDWKVVGAGDFNGDGRDDVLWRNSRTGANTIWRSGDYRSEQHVTHVVDLAWEVVGVGDFDGDGYSDILWRNSRTGANTIWRRGDYGNQQRMVGVADLAWKVVGTGDFDGDGIDDVLWRHGGRGANAVWYSAEYARYEALTGVTNLAWEVVAVGDYNGDGLADIAWRNRTTGANVVWRAADYHDQMQVTTVPDAAWKVVP